MDRVGMEMLSALGMPPVEFTHLAADLGCSHLSTGLAGVPVPTVRYPPFSLRDDASLRREFLAVLNDRGVSVSLGEGLLIAPGLDARSYEHDLDVMHELRIPRVNVVSFEPDLSRTYDELAVLAESAAQRAIATSIEPTPGLTIADLPTACAAINHVGADRLSLVIDTMHVARSGATADDLRELPSDSIRYVQICDTMLEGSMENYLEEAMFHRMAPGDGELPLLDLLQALPRDTVVGIEVPMLTLAESGVSPRDRLRPCVDATRKLLSQLV